MEPGFVSKVEVFRIKINNKIDNAKTFDKLAFLQILLWILMDLSIRDKARCKLQYIMPFEASILSYYYL